MFSDWWWSSGAEANKEDGFEIKNSLRFRGGQYLSLIHISEPTRPY